MIETQINGKFCKSSALVSVKSVDKISEALTELFVPKNSQVTHTYLYAQLVLI
jgi:hypothetical protein